MKCYELTFSFYCGSSEKKIYRTIWGTTIAELEEAFKSETDTMYERVTENKVRRRKTKEEKWLSIAKDIKYITFKTPYVLKHMECD